LKWKQLGRRDFVTWQEAEGDTVSAPLAFRDDVQDAKDPAETIPFQ
jgi:hypothetical protein